MAEQPFKEKTIEHILELKHEQDEAIAQTVAQHSREEDLVNQLCEQLDISFVMCLTQEQRTLDYIDVLNKRLSHLYHLREMMQTRGYIIR